jgi:hypothetical protein
MGGGGRGGALFQNFDIIKWMEYWTVFDILQVGYRSWPSVLVGLAFMLIGVSMFVFPRFWEKIPLRGPEFMRRYSAYILTGFAAIWTLFAFVGTYSDYAYAKNEYLQGKAEVIEGTVSNFKPGTNMRGSAYESFCVKDKCFTYSDYEEQAGFNTMTINGGPIREGLPVRVTFVGNTIVKLEVASSTK